MADGHPEGDVAQQGHDQQPPGPSRRAVPSSHALRVSSQSQLPATVVRVAEVSTEEMAAWLDQFDSYAEHEGAPLLAVLDTCAVRTGLRHQLRYGEPPKSVRLAAGGSLRLFMEYDTLAETDARLSRVRRAVRGAD
jgi:hypothetical protein